MTLEWVEVSTGRWKLVNLDGPPKRVKKTGNPWDKGHISRTIGVHPAQAEEFTKQARMMGNQDVEYDRTTGFLISRSREGRAAEAARRQHWDGQGGDVEERYAKLLGK